MLLASEGSRFLSRLARWHWLNSGHELGATIMGESASFADDCWSSRVVLPFRDASVEPLVTCAPECFFVAAP